VHPGLYDCFTAPLERRALAPWRAILWRQLSALLMAAPTSTRSATANGADDDAPLGLEIGAGTGANLARYPRDTRVVAIDRSLAMLRKTRARMETGGGDPTAAWLVVADATALPFRGETFAWAVETFVFCEVGDPVAGLVDVGRVLRQGAPFLMLEHVRPAGWLGRMAGLLTRVTAPLWGEHLDRDAAAAVRRAGLRVERQTWLWRDVVTLIEVRAGPTAPG
jgi:ubiquinone/menaquinone biosynthesis C-methylase UbiE